MIKEFDYKSFTLEEIEKFTLYHFIFDADKGKIVVVPNEKYTEIIEFLYEQYIERLKEKYNV